MVREISITSKDELSEDQIDKIKDGSSKFLWGWKCRAGKTYGVGHLIDMYYKNFEMINLGGGEGTSGARRAVSAPAAPDARPDNYTSA